MKKYLKIAFYSILALVMLALISGGLFVYKTFYGFNFYDSEPPELPAELGERAVIVFSKTNAFRHDEAIEASQPVFQQMAEEKGWTLFSTENGAVFNPEQLQYFDVVVWNNVTGKALSSEQREYFRDWLEQGGAYVGIHAAGDFSHQWEWYEQQVIGARYSHHTLHPQFQEGHLKLEFDEDHPELSEGLPDTWTREEEWYVFYDTPRDRGFKILYTLDGTGIEPDGTIPILLPDRDWGMGPDHPVAWYRTMGEARIFYTSMGHQAGAFEEPDFLRMLENAIRWAGRLD